MKSDDKILVVFGTRPEAIKMALLIKELKQAFPHNSILVCVTAQHRDMLDQVLTVFDITPDFDLSVMTPNQDLTQLTTVILEKMKPVLETVHPAMVLVHGDTTTTFAVSLACYYQKIPVAHVEAGLRTGDIYSPWPEEINRKLTTGLASVHFAPTVEAEKNLLKEGVSKDKIIVTGNTVIDALYYTRDKIDSSPALKKKLTQQIQETGYPVSDRKFVLITGHRRENFGEGILQICEAIVSLSKQFPDVDWVYPVHLNPNIEDPVYIALSDLSNVFLIKPLDYMPFVLLMNQAYFILTDSGGIQEEGPSLGKPVLVMRDVTERPEAVAAGTVKLVGSDSTKIIENVTRLLTDSDCYNQMAVAHNPYGDGKAVERIVSFFKTLRLQEN
jgi:UDP-N-acetylglucosamine 2-epimerase (non-hydrolysing)